jgi:hypothetical protein
VARRYEYYFRVVKTILYERAQRVSRIVFLTRENNIHIFEPPCNVLFIIWTKMKRNSVRTDLAYLATNGRARKHTR